MSIDVSSGNIFDPYSNYTLNFPLKESIYFYLDEENFLKMKEDGLFKKEDVNFKDYEIGDSYNLNLEDFIVDSLEENKKVYFLNKVLFSRETFKENYTNPLAKKLENGEIILTSIKENFCDIHRYSRIRPKITSYFRIVAKNLLEISMPGSKYYIKIFEDHLTSHKIFTSKSYHIRSENIVYVIEELENDYYNNLYTTPKKVAYFFKDNNLYDHFLSGKKMMDIKNLILKGEVMTEENYDNLKRLFLSKSEETFTLAYNLLFNFSFEKSPVEFALLLNFAEKSYLNNRSKKTKFETYLKMIKENFPGHPAFIHNRYAYDANNRAKFFFNIEKNYPDNEHALNEFQDWKNSFITN